jgi:hypothetical protein
VWKFRLGAGKVRPTGRKPIMTNRTGVPSRSFSDVNASVIFMAGPIVQNLDAEINRLEKARALLTGHTAPLKRGVAPRVSAEGRARIAAAQRKRWAKAKK